MPAQTTPPAPIAISPDDEDLMEVQAAYGELSNAAQTFESMRQKIKDLIPRSHEVSPEEQELDNLSESIENLPE